MIRALGVFGAQMGDMSDGGYRLDATSPDNAATGHAHATDCPREDMRELIGYLKTR